MNLKNKNILVLGAGISGMDAALLALRHGARVTLRDEASGEGLRDRTASLISQGIRVELGAAAFGANVFDEVILSPGINLQAPIVRPFVEQKIPVMGELEFGFRFCECPIVAITGTNGKTTTTELVTSALLKAGWKTSAAGNIGKALSAVASESKSMKALVVEVSSFQLETINTFHPKVALYLNLTPDHLDRYPSMKEYGAAKERIFENQNEQDVAVVNFNLTLPSIRARRVTFSAWDLRADYTLQDGVLLAQGESILAQKETQLLGRHNAENLLATLATTDALGIERTPVVEALKAYRPQPHRCEPILEIDGVLYLNDSKGTNVDAIEKALTAVERPVVLIAGGKDKGLDFSGLREIVARRVKSAVLIGETRERIARDWKGAVMCEFSETLEAAVRRARDLAVSGDAVLFSPGCSSFDMFKNYAHRGDCFRQEVLAMNHPTTNPKEKNHGK